jgi:ribosomal protein S14
MIMITSMGRRTGTRCAKCLRAREYIRKEFAFVRISRRGFIEDAESGDGIWVMPAREVSELCVAGFGDWEERSEQEYLVCCLDPGQSSLWRFVWAEIPSVGRSSDFLPEREGRERESYSSLCQITILSVPACLSRYATPLHELPRGSWNASPPCFFVIFILISLLSCFISENEREKKLKLKMKWNI